jgi:hypothetical protein
VQQFMPVRFLSEHAAPEAVASNDASCVNHDMTPLLRRSFHAGGQPVRVQIGGRSGCPWVTAGDRSFPPVLVRMWHGYGHLRRMPTGPSMARALG